MSYLLQISIEDVVRRILSKKNVMIYGQLETGKTDFSLLLAEYGLKYGIIEYAFTNIKLLEKYDRIIEVHDNIALKKNLEKYRKNKKIVVIDEAGLIASSRRVLSKKNEYFMRLCRLARKYRASLIYVTQAIEDLDPGIRRLVQCEIQKVSKKTAIVSLIDMEYDIEIHNIPPTSIKFDTYDIAEFEFKDEAKEQMKELITFDEYALLYAYYINNFHYDRTAKFLFNLGFTKYKQGKDFRYDFNKIIRKIIEKYKEVYGEIDFSKL